jgi:putative membrane protein
MKSIRYYLLLALKGAGMGAANVIPGVSGGTVALVTGIFEELIDSIKSFNLTALNLLIKGKFSDFSRHINLNFLLAVFLGITVSIFSLARILEFLFVYYPIYIWAYFFGLILASIYFVGRTVSEWKTSVVISFLAGTTIALLVSLLSPANENNSFLYLILCGIIAMCSMILPGLSGSFVLILLGNYQLVIKAVSDLNFEILAPVIVGAIIGIVGFSYLLSWIFKRFRNQTIASLTGFILGSLIILWPWKISFGSNGEIIPVNAVGAFVNDQGTVLGDVKIFRYKQVLPENIDVVLLLAGLLIVAGIVSVWMMERFGAEKKIV